MTQAKPLRLLLIADRDSQLLACEALCRFSAEQAVELTINVIPRDGTPPALLQRVAGLGTVWQQQLAPLLRDRRLFDVDAIGVFLTGSKLNDIRLALDRHGQRPVLFCGFNGVVLEHFIEGISWRLGYDLICLSGPRDQQRLDQLLANTPYSGQRTVLTGLRRNSAVELPLKPREQRPKRLVFAEQVIMPATAKERARMVRILADLAERSPDWEVLIKPRIAPGDATFHDVDTHISATVRSTLGCPPANLRLDYRPLPDLLRQARLMATLSSTAFFDALDFGCSPVVMADLGLNPRYGGHVFAGSGVWRTLATVSDLDALEQDLPDPDPAWLAWMGYSGHGGPDALLDAIRRLPGPTVQPAVPGYLANAKSSFNQLRLGAEAAIAMGDWQEARELLNQAAQMRPQHRGVAQRHCAVSRSNPLLRALLLRITYRDLG